MARPRSARGARVTATPTGAAVNMRGIAGSALAAVATDTGVTTGATETL